MTWKSCAALAALIALVTGCTAPAPWPVPVSPEVQRAQTGSPCPAIAGTYGNTAETDGSCSTLDAKACGSLSFYLFSSHVPEAAGVSNFPTPSDDWPSGTHVEIEQPNADVLRFISARPSQAGGAEILASRDLNRLRGDFTCDGNAIRLRPRVERDAELWMGRRTNTEYLELSSEQDALVVQSTRHYETYLLWLVGGTMREEHSRHRWEKLK